MQPYYYRIIALLLSIMITYYLLLLYVLMYDVEVRCNALRCSMHAIRYTIHTFHETLVVIPTKMNEGIGIGKYLVFVFVLLLV